MAAITAKELTDFLGKMENLKCKTRHCFTSTGRPESVAEHCWRMAVMALLLRDCYPDINMDTVVEMALVHDWGEAILGDVPAFEKTDADRKAESHSLNTLLAPLPENLQTRFRHLCAEFESGESAEAQLCRALDKLEAVIQHNESDISTWLPLEHDLQLIYGNEECEFSPYTQELRDYTRRISEKKIADATP